MLQNNFFAASLATETLPLGLASPEDEGGPDLLYFSLLILTAIIMTFKNIKAYSSHALTILHVSFQQLAILAVHADGLERHRAVEAHFSGFTVHAFD